MDLPEECWEWICKAIDENDYQSLESLSLVSSSFLSITNRVRSSLVITEHTLPFLRRHLRRFRKLKRIRFIFFNDVEDLTSILHQISLSDLDLESLDFSGVSYLPDFEVLGIEMMRNVKELNCSRVKEVLDSDMVSIGMCFPSLEKLDLSYLNSHQSTVSDSGVISLSSNLKRLTKIDVSGNKLITDQSLVSLSQNCILLREIAFLGCDNISSHCIEFILRNSWNLQSFGVSRFGYPPKEFFSRDTFLFARCLSKLDLSISYLTPELIRLIADANLPLKKLVLSDCYTLTFAGVWCLLAKYQKLVHLNLARSFFLCDEMIMKLGMFIRRLTFVNLSFCIKLTGLAFFSIIETCVSLKCMKMEGTKFGIEEYSKEVDVKSGIKLLYISKNRYLRDESLEKLSRCCPYVETLDVAECPGITGDGILEVLRNCGNLKSLKISRCIGVKNLGLLVDFEFPKLKSLEACGTGIEDDDLEMISKRCRGLLYLDLKGCFNVRSRGVEKVMLRCRCLREINLSYSQTVDGIFSWLVCASPSLRKIVLPLDFKPSRKLKSFFLRRGCVLCH